MSEMICWLTVQVTCRCLLFPVGFLLKWTNENNRRDFNFMRGEEEYKFRFSAVDRWVVRVQLINSAQNQSG
jgi:hypothetical protein